MNSDNLIQKANNWLQPHFDKNTQAAIQNLIDGPNEALEDAFYTSLAFGTGGMRGIMGAGDNRINKYTLGKATQGLSNYLKSEFAEESAKESLRVVIAYDCRHNSDTLAQTVAEVFSANGVQVKLFSSLRPTPELSFAVRELQCHCGIVLTASHNPPEYNGYKVYWQDGGQLVPPQDRAIINEINALDYKDIQFEPEHGLIQRIDKEVDEAFIKASLKAVPKLATTEDRSALSVVFTPLHGTSVTMVPPVLAAAGFERVHLVKEQATPDGDFPTVSSPNPEEPQALKMAMDQAQEFGADIVIGTDPDCDRLGIAVRDAAGVLTLLNGNQAMIIKTHFLLDKLKDEQKTKKSFIASTIVSTPMMRILADDFGVDYKEGLTGFKWIAKMVKDYPEQEFIGGGEESFGYMVGDFVRDKDAVTASLLICEIAAYLKGQGSSVWAYLEQLYQQYGYFQEALISQVKKGRQGAEEIKAIMSLFRQSPPKTIAGSPVTKIEDYQSKKVLDLLSGQEYPLDLPASNVLIFYTQSGAKIAARPSGTEPKIKYYISVTGRKNEELAPQIEAIKTDLNLL
ncbi:MAG TPA: phosphoglucomutase [Flavobacteriaceae bacterium]|nr:phosphoglucomutase [Flavobacteriaceae bacterium]